MTPQEALAKYGHHLDWCSRWFCWHAEHLPECCTCGFEEALASHAPIDETTEMIAGHKRGCALFGTTVKCTCGVEKPSKAAMCQELAQLKAAYQKAIACVPTELLNLYFQETK